MQIISVEQYHKIKDSCITIDVRTSIEVQMLYKMDWAINIPINKLMNNLENTFPDKTKIIVTICNAGNRSGEAATMLYDAGYKKSYVLDGGLFNYNRSYKLK